MAAPPETSRKPVTDQYHGVEVVDDYRWLENGGDPIVRAWSDAQNGHARNYLDHLPHLEEIRQRVTEIMAAPTVSYSAAAYRRGTVFVIQRQPPREQPFLVVMPSLDSTDNARVLVDPNAIDPTHATSIDWYAPSPDGQLVAVSLSSSGSEAGDVHFFATATGKAMHEVLPRVNTGTAGGDLAWMPDSSGVFYTRHPREGERTAEDMNFYQQVYFHRFGTPTEKDRYELGKDFPRIAEIQFEMHNPTGRLLATVQNGDGGEFAHYLRSPAGDWTRLCDFKDQIVQATFSPAGDLYLISQANAPRGKILRARSLSAGLADAETIIEEGDYTIVTSFYHAPPSLLATDTRLYVLYQLGGPSELRVFDLEGRRLPGPQQPPLSAAGGLAKLEGDDVLFGVVSYVQPPAMHRFQAESGQTEPTALATKSPVAFDDIEVVREFATSADGTRVPVSILYRQGLTRNGENPTLVTGYGGYGINITPSFSSVRHVLLEQGFVIAIANLRGGSEFGEPWHQQGNLTNKQNVFDDFAAVLRHVVERQYTSPDRLAIEGGSNGGLLMGATMTQHPELMKAVVSHVGIYDMLRVELSANGAFNIVEFGTVKDAEQFRALHAYSPYHHVRPGTAYPPVLFLTGENDPRVDPMQSRKMTARLQAAGDNGVYLRTSSNTGHGAGTALSERIEQTVDVYAFLAEQLQVNWSQPAGNKK
ncbi:MAG: prolyl oligopeptidase family protein [Pirellulales bacterium]